MRIGKLVKLYVPDIFHYCENNDMSELSRLMNKVHSKQTFNINFPFCSECSSISKSESPRYWVDKFIVQGKEVRVCSQWYHRNQEYFNRYLVHHSLAIEAELDANDSQSDELAIGAGVECIARGRYKGKAIGDAQNALIRNILSNLGKESFNKDDWDRTKEYFSNRCVYCSDSKSLQMDHAIPINKSSLGEHRLGNLVPSCKDCNSKKGAKDFREFLDDEGKISKIEEYMASKHYMPLEKDNDQLEKILEMARQDVLAVAGRYTTILNDLFIKPPSDVAD